MRLIFVVILLLILLLFILKYKQHFSSYWCVDSSDSAITANNAIIDELNSKLVTNKTRNLQIIGTNRQATFTLHEEFIIFFEIRLTQAWQNRDQYWTTTGDRLHSLIEFKLKGTEQKLINIQYLDWETKGPSLQFDIFKDGTKMSNDNTRYTIDRDTNNFVTFEIKQRKYNEESKITISYKEGRITSNNCWKRPKTEIPITNGNFIFNGLQNQIESLLFINPIIFNDDKQAEMKFVYKKMCPSSTNQITYYCNATNETLVNTNSDKINNDTILNYITTYNCNSEDYNYPLSFNFPDTSSDKIVNVSNGNFKLHKEFELEVHLDNTKYVDNKILYLCKQKENTNNNVFDENNSEIFIYVARHRGYNVVVFRYGTSGQRNHVYIFHHTRFKITVKKNIDGDYMLYFFYYVEDSKHWFGPVNYKNGSDNDILSWVNINDNYDNLFGDNESLDMNLYMNTNYLKEGKRIINKIKYTNLNEQNSYGKYNNYKEEKDNNDNIVVKLNAILNSLEIYSDKVVNIDSEGKQLDLLFTLHNEFEITFNYKKNPNAETGNLLKFENKNATIITIDQIEGGLNIKINKQIQGTNRVTTEEVVNTDMLVHYRSTIYKIKLIQIDNLFRIRLYTETHGSYYYPLNTGLRNYSVKKIFTSIRGLTLIVNKKRWGISNMKNFTYKCLNPPVECLPISPECNYTSEFESKEPTLISDRECSQVTECIQDVDYQTAAATNTKDRTCSGVREPCGNNEFESQSPTLRVNRTCTDLTECKSSEEYESTPPGIKTNRICSPLEVCNDTQYESKAPEKNSNGKYVTQRVCSNIKECNSSEYESASATTTSDRVCNPLTVCSNIEYELTAPTKTTDRQCGERPRNIYGKFVIPKEIETFENNDQGQFLSDVEREKYTKKDITYSAGGTYLNNGVAKPCSQSCYIKNPRHFETQACSKNTNRVCKKCKTCELGKEYIKKFCGESGGSSDTKCSPCKICGEKEFKVEGCTISNRNRDTICKKKTICKGRNPSNTNNYIEPGEGNYTYEKDPGYSMGTESPYIGKDRVCAKCKECPPHSKPIGGCVGENSKVNTKCQKLLNIDKILENQPKCGENKYYNISKARTYLESKNDNLIASAQRKPLNENYEEVPLPDITDEILIREGCVKCIDKGTKYFYQNENNPGCEGFIGSATSQDRIYIPRTICKKNEMIIKKGGEFSDDVCGPCRCPPGKIGTNPDCDGTEIVKNCEENIPCSQIDKKKNLIIGLDSGNSNSKVYTYDKPSAYGDTTKQDKCKVCDTKCPPGTFQLQECDPLRSTNLVCKDHTTCDPETQIVLEPGTSTNDTICKCIDGYEWQKDNLDQPHYNKPCVEIKGKCWTNPCHEKATCYDEFENGKFKDYICNCDISNNWVETDNKGKGPNGCTKISDTHSHDVNERPKLSDNQNLDYADLLNLKPNALNVIHHTDGIEGAPSSSGTFHSSLLGNHIHK